MPLAAASALISETLAAECLILSRQRLTLLSINGSRPHRKLVKHYHEASNANLARGHSPSRCSEKRPILD
jgi:hypothetical protein